MSDTALVNTGEWVPVNADVRQQVLVLYLGGSALDTGVVAWSMYDGAGTATIETGEEDEPPYRTGIEALRDGWRLLSMSQMLPPGRDLEYSTDHHNYECVFERLVTQRPWQKEER
jgi:hypothetical protein